MQKSLITIFIIIFFNSCGGEEVSKVKELNRNNPLILHKNEQKLSLQKDKIELEKLKLKNRIELKELELKKEEIIQKNLTKRENIEANKTITISNIRKDTLLKLENKRLENNKLYSILAFTILLLLLLIWLVRYILKRKYELKIKEQELRNQLIIEENRLKHQNLSKILSIISDKNIDKGTKKELTRAITEIKLLEYKKK